ncbi:MAG: hypothetical protein IE909_00980 [Campylobacterales bacterium]|nr:hypothetical protein [Campylobacterales bacterium]
MILIHSALQCEAQIFIEKLKLRKISSNPKIFANNSHIVLISGIGKENTVSALTNLFNSHKIDRAINIGIAGCNDFEVSIGSCFCTTPYPKEFEYLPLITSNSVVNSTNEIYGCLYDMEGKYFLDVVSNYLNGEKIYIFKVVSDHLDCKKITKEFVKTLMVQNYNQLEKYFTI